MYANVEETYLPRNLETRSRYVSKMVSYTCLLCYVMEF